MSGSITKSPERSIRRHLMVGVAACIILVAGAGGLAAMTKISGAVIAAGTLVVDSSVKRVQHLTGGVVSEIDVRDGAAVKANQVLIKLDATKIRANLAIVSKGLDEFYTRLARLQAERDGADTITFPADIAARKADPTVAGLLAGEQSLFEARKEARKNQKAQLQERITQLGSEVTGLEQQQAAKRKEIDLIAVELEGARKLWKSRYTSIDRLTALERDAARLEGENGTLTAAIAQSKGRTAEIKLQIIQIDQDLRTEVAKELREIQARVSEFVERKVAAEDDLKRVDIRSPQDGVVHQLAVHTVGGVVSPGQPIMLIVPVSDALTVEAHVAPQDIDQLSAGQEAVLRLSAFNMQTTPEIKGKLLSVSADLTVDERTGYGYYKARVALPPEELTKLRGLALAPGMPVETFFPTQERTVLSYFVKPLTDQLNRAFREE